MSFLPRWEDSHQKMRAFIIGRACRWDQLLLPNDEICTLAIDVAMKLAAENWTKRDLRRLAFGLRGPNRGDSCNIMRLALLTLTHPCATMTILTPPTLAPPPPAWVPDPGPCGSARALGAGPKQRRAARGLTMTEDTLTP